MQSIIKENTLSSDEEEFYLKMVEYIYELFCRLRHSSLEIEKIINLYMCINSNSHHHLDNEYGLDKSTFKFMIDSDDTIKNLLKICRKRLFEKQTMSVEHIEEITQMISKSDYDNYYADDEDHTEKSTSVDEEEE